MVLGKIIDPVLAKIDGERRAYFSAVADFPHRDDDE